MENRDNTVTSSGPFEYVLNLVEPNVRSSCQAVDAKINQVANNVFGLCAIATEEGFLWQKPSNDVVFGVAQFAKCVTPLVVVMYFGPVGIYGTLLLLPIAKHVANKSATIAGNIASHAALSIMGYGEFLDRVNKSVGTDDVPFTVSVLGIMAGDAVSFGIRDIPIDTIAKATARVAIIAPIKLMAKAAAQAGFNSIFGWEYTTNPTFGIESGTGRKPYRTPRGHLQISKVLEEIACTWGGIAAASSVELDDQYARLAVKFGGGYLGTEISRFVMSFPESAVEMQKRNNGLAKRRQNSGLYTFPRIRKFLFPYQ